MRALVLVAVLLAPAGAAHARSGITLGLRAGGGVPYGRTASVAALSDELRFALPLTAEVTLAASPRLSVGPFLQYGVGALSQSAPLGSGACSRHGEPLRGRARPPHRRAAHLDPRRLAAA